MATNPAEQTVRELMRSDFISTSGDESLLSVAQIMRLGRLRHLPVVDGSALVGVVSHRDILEASISRVEVVDRPERLRRLASIDVREVMTTDPFTIGPEQTLEQAAIRMLRYKIGCLPVVDPNKNGGALVGLITESDLLRAVDYLNP